MRWTKKPRLKGGDMRTISRFLWLPVTIELEVRWLERATIKQRYEGGFGEGGWWKNEEWVK